MANIKLKLQIMCGDMIAMGPGKAQLLESIQASGSISGAARLMNMSYRRAWQLVDVMNRCWIDRLVETAPGRAAGGARLTQLGLAILGRYRTLQAVLDNAASQEWQELATLVRNEPLQQQAINLPADKTIN